MVTSIKLGGDNVEDYFDVTFWQGAGSSNTNIRTGVDLSSSGNGGMVMIKSAIQRDWSVTDTVRGVNSQLASNRNYAQTTETDHVTHFLDYGFTLGADDRVNRSGTNSLAFTFQKKNLNFLTFKLGRVIQQLADKFFINLVKPLLWFG